MTGWNMPPGCNVSDIPGNRAEDQKAEEMAERIANALEALCTLAHELIERRGGPDSDHSIVDRAEDAVTLELMKLIDKAYSTGYADGMADEQEAASYKGSQNE